MNGADDRLAGDPVWEIFAPATPGSGREASRAWSLGRWLLMAGWVAVCWRWHPAPAVGAACLGVAAGDFRKAQRIGESIPRKAGVRICAAFTFAWGAWKMGVAAFVLMFIPVLQVAIAGKPAELPSSFIAATLFCMFGFTISAVLTALGLLEAYRSEMRVWIGEGVNQARTLLTGMLIVGFAFVAIGPLAVWMTTRFSRATDGRAGETLGLMALLGCMFVGPVVILLILDGIGRRVIADRPGKFGPKVPAVGKWSS